MDSLYKLNETNQPLKSMFYSKFRRSNISEEKYNTVVKAWNDNNMKSVSDLLVWYNNLNVKPFLLALDSQSEMYMDKGIDMLTRATSLPDWQCCGYLTQSVIGFLSRKPLKRTKQVTVFFRGRRLGS